MGGFIFSNSRLLITLCFYILPSDLQCSSTRFTSIPRCGHREVYSHHPLELINTYDKLLVKHFEYHYFHFLQKLFILNIILMSKWRIRFNLLHLPWGLNFNIDHALFKSKGASISLPHVSKKRLPVGYGWLLVSLYDPCSLQPGERAFNSSNQILSP